VPNILAQFRGREVELWAKIQEKYLPVEIRNSGLNLATSAGAASGAAAAQIERDKDDRDETEEAKSINPILVSQHDVSEITSEGYGSTKPTSSEAIAVGVGAGASTAVATADVSVSVPVVGSSTAAASTTVAAIPVSLTSSNCASSKSHSSTNGSSNSRTSNCTVSHHGRQRTLASKLAGDAAEARQRATAAAAALDNVGTDCTGLGGTTAAARALNPDMNALAAGDGDNGDLRRDNAASTAETTTGSSSSTAMTSAAAAASTVLAHLSADQVPFKRILHKKRWNRCVVCSLFRPVMYLSSLPP
jgi:hypothetical protein